MTVMRSVLLLPIRSSLWRVRDPAGLGCACGIVGARPSASGRVRIGPIRGHTVPHDVRAEPCPTLPQIHVPRRRRDLDRLPFQYASRSARLDPTASSRPPASQRTPIPVLVQSVYKTFPGPTRKEFRKLFGMIRTPLHDVAMPDDFMQLAVLGRICLGAGSLADLGISNASSYTRDDYDRICRASTMHPSALTSDIVYLCLFGESRYPPAQTWRTSIPWADRSGTYSDCVETAALNLLTAILYDVNTTTISRLHRLRSPELIAFYHRFQTPSALATELCHIEFAQVIRERCRQVVAFVHPGSASEVKSGRANFANLVHCLAGIEFDALLADFVVCRDQDTFTFA
ncbi:Uncharacterized protein PBTT_06854 [Plasmodiophora brassicae]|uniref:Uncharacterized protein n=1 Tax=Plasmodiophora brassicae TaxID=37360 RepID=A0A0G4J902_PLABS|nr:hypothetical protein PBRA_003516 [Plasmodiophora brassicae]